LRTGAGRIDGIWASELPAALGCLALAMLLVERALAHTLSIS
jgi:hypothetical protein